MKTITLFALIIFGFSASSAQAAPIPAPVETSFDLNLTFANGDAVSGEADFYQQAFSHDYTVTGLFSLNGTPIDASFSVEGSPNVAQVMLTPMETLIASNLSAMPDLNYTDFSIGNIVSTGGSVTEIVSASAVPLSSTAYLFLTALAGLALFALWKKTTI